MILTNCAACAAPLAHNAPRCVSCQTSIVMKQAYQMDHWAATTDQKISAAATRSNTTPTKNTRVLAVRYAAFRTLYLSDNWKTKEASARVCVPRDGGFRDVSCLAFRAGRYF